MRPGEPHAKGETSSSLQPPEERLIHLRNRHLIGQLEKSGRFWPVVGLLGLRQCGKSTLLSSLLAVPNHVTLDDQDAVEDARISAKNFLAKLPTPLAIDEAQKVPALFDAIKLAVDRRRAPGKYFLTGSSQFSARLGIRESLTGRIGLHYLYPLTLAEAHQTEFSADRATPLHREQPRFQQARALEQLACGGLPTPLFTRGTEERKLFFTGWLETMVERDAARAFGGRYDPDTGWSILRQMSRVLADGEAVILRLAHGLMIPSRFLRTLLSTAGIIMLAAAACPAASRANTGHPGLRNLPAVVPVTSCESLRTADLSGVADRPVHITSAMKAADSSAHAYCKVDGYVEPAVKFEVHLPLHGWTQRYLQLGCGGLCGVLRVRLGDYEQSCVPAASGDLALASTDMGHEDRMDGRWAADNPQARVDFAYRGVHVTALVAKALIHRFYGQAPRFAYFSGCSDGGREALMEAQRYPHDFNGIAAGAPALNFTVQNSFYHAWNALSNTGPDGNAILTVSKLPILHAAAIAACDATDGLKDGLISEPRRCNFDPVVAQCRPREDPSRCLTPAQVEVARRIYAGAHDAKGRKLIVGGPMPGSELAWAGVYVPQAPGQPIFSAMIATGSLKYLYYPRPLPASWTLKDLKFDQATLDSFPYRGMYDATNPDLSAFRAAGGRLLMWHGWSDQHISPLNSIVYYQAVEKLMGADRVTRFARLFLIPGVYHCGGGDLAQFDVLTPLMEWVESGAAADRLLASQVQSSGKEAPRVVRSRPVFPFPEIARYTGKGSVDDPSSFVPAPPAPADVAPIQWLGAKYMAPGR